MRLFRRLRGAEVPKSPVDLQNVVELGEITNCDIHPDRILSAALGKLQDVLIIGWDKDGTLHVTHSTAHGPSLLWLLEKARLYIVEE